MQKDFNQHYLIFVGGAPRSGTTLVQRVLAAHSMVYGGPEFDLIPEIVRLRNQFINKVESGRISTYLDKDGVDNAFRKFLLAIFHKKIRETGKVYFSEKTPANLEVFPELLEIFPDALFIYVMRDPRAIVASLLEVGNRYRKDDKLSPVFTRSARRAIDYINHLWAKGGSVLSKSNKVFLVYYEDIVSNAYSTIEGLANFIGLPFEEGTISIQDKEWDLPHNISSGNGYTYTKEQLREGINDGALNKWQSVLTNYDQYLIDKHLIRMPGVTERYDLSVNHHMGWVLKDSLGTFWARLIKLLVKGMSKAVKVYTKGYYKKV